MHADESVTKADDSLKSSSDKSVVGATDRVSQFWETYSKEADDYDKDFSLKNGNNIEGVLIFAGLFSAVSASFLVSTQSDLQPNPTDTTNALLMMLVNANNNGTSANLALEIPVWNGPSSATVCSQVLGYAALSAGLLAALGAVLGKQWLGDFTRLRGGPLQERGRRRQQKLDGLRKWRFEVFMGALPALIQLALLLFSISLCIRLWQLNHGVGSMVIVATGLGALFYSFITLASLLSPTCPFHTPVSSTIRVATGIAMKSIEEIAEYWAWRSEDSEARLTISRANKVLAHIAAAFFSSLLAITSIILLAMLAAFVPIFALVAWIRGGGALQDQVDFYRLAFWSKSRSIFHDSMCSVYNSARRARDFIRRAYLDPDPDPLDSDPHSIAWVLETSTDHDNLMAAAELVPDVRWPDDLNISLPTEHLYSIFIRSIPEKGSSNERALRLGKAFVIMLCQLSDGINARVWQSALERVKKESMRPDVDSDLCFILAIATKLLSRKLGSEDRGVDFPPHREVSQPLLAWLLQPLETLLRLEYSRQSRFLPEAYRVFLRLKWPEESKLERMQQMQYCRTFEIYFNSVVGSTFDQMDEAVEQNSQDDDRAQADLLGRVLEKLKGVDPLRLSDDHQHLIVPLTVLSRLASIPSLRQVLEDSNVNPWMIAAFKEAVSKADENGESIWLFASCLLQLATVVDAFNPIKNPRGDANERGQTPDPALRMDSKSLLSYLLNRETPATPEQVEYALGIMLANVDEHPVLASVPHFVNYILYATGPGQVYSIRDIGVKVLIAACQSLLCTYDKDSLVTLDADCDLAHFLHRAILNQDPATMLKDLLRVSDEDFNERLLGILAPALGDPFNTLLTKLHDEPNKIPERDLRDLEIALVLSNDEGRKKLLFDHLDHCIARMPHLNHHYPMALPLTVIVGWLLRRDGPVGASESLWKEFLRPNFELLLFPAWGDPDALEENPQMLRLLLDCTANWLSTHAYVRPETRASSELASDATLVRLQSSLDQLTSGNRTLSLDIKRALQKLSRKIGRHVQG